jgi:hypothetical protein
MKAAPPSVHGVRPDAEMIFPEQAVDTFQVQHLKET